MIPRTGGLLKCGFKLSVASALEMKNKASNLNVHVSVVKADCCVCVAVSVCDAMLKSLGYFDVRH